MQVYTLFNYSWEPLSQWVAVEAKNILGPRPAPADFAKSLLLYES